MMVAKTEDFTQNRGGSFLEMTRRGKSRSFKTIAAKHNSLPGNTLRQLKKLDLPVGINLSTIESCKKKTTLPPADFHDAS
jgi:hypothetical protein